MPLQSVCPGADIQHSQLPTAPLVVGLVLRELAGSGVSAPAPGACASLEALGGLGASKRSANAASCHNYSPALARQNFSEGPGPCPVPSRGRVPVRGYQSRTASQEPPCFGSRDGRGRRRPVIAGQKCNRRAGTGKTDGINRTYAPVIGACCVIAGQKWRSSPLMTLDHAERPIRHGVSRTNGGNVRSVGCPGRRLAGFDPRS